MSLLKIGVAREVHIRLPRVVRYIDAEWVDRFFDEGSLRLSSFRRCARHDDEARHDAREGRSSVQAVAADGSTLAAITLPAPTFYVLCCSMVLDLEHRDLFGVSGGYIIADPLQFAVAIANALPVCQNLAQGPCFYCPEEVRRAELSEPLFTEDPKSEADLERIPQALRRIDGLESIFTKPPEPFSKQHEYRFIWDIGQDVDETLDFVCPAAVRFCTRAPVLAS